MEKIKIVLHASLESDDINRLNEIHNEMMVKIVKKRLSESRAGIKERKEYIESLLKIFEG